MQVLGAAVYARAREHLAGALRTLGPFAVEPFGAWPDMWALGVAVLPGLAGRDVMSLGAQVIAPLGESEGNELGAIAEAHSPPATMGKVELELPMRTCPAPVCATMPLSPPCWSDSGVA